MPDTSSDLRIIVDKSAVVQHGSKIRRVSMANGEIAEAVAVSSNEVLINGKAPGETSLILWDAKGSRTRFEIHVVANDGKLEAVRRELRKSWRARTFHSLLKTVMYFFVAR